MYLHLVVITFISKPWRDFINIHDALPTSRVVCLPQPSRAVHVVDIVR